MCIWFICRLDDGCHKVLISANIECSRTIQKHGQMHAPHVCVLFQNKSCLRLCCEWCSSGCCNDDLEEIHPIPDVSSVGLLPQQHSGNQSDNSSTLAETIYTRNTDPRYLTQYESMVLHPSHMSSTVCAQNLQSNQLHLNEKL